MQDPEYTADFESLLKLCIDRNVAVQTIKSLAYRPWGNKKKPKPHGTNLLRIKSILTVLFIGF